ncbi:hypothetical protein CRENBAI_008748 [Crenichthys baileyi]|uniref:XRN2-binding (XTBD) domain-containing protein n=1 Tax=Crenichthys baileyi TaxID=28760 RepID=A0AAV9QNY9_9TELE
MSCYVAPPPQCGAAGKNPQKESFGKDVTGSCFFLTRWYRRKMSALDVQDFIQQNRAVADQVETFRGYWESEKHWEARREFILRNMNDFKAEQLDHLLSLSMVWANNVFMGCRYSTELLEKVKEMAEGIVVEDAPVFKTRDEIMKNQQGR